jgi:serine/threonine protein kinase
MPISTPDLSALSQLLDQAWGLQPEQVETWLAALPVEHRHLAPQLRQMLEQHHSARREDFLASGPRLADRTSDDTTAKAGDMVGPYRLIVQIGQGGMGAVWLADRIDGGLNRRIALKLPRLAWGAGLAERIARERDIGARLEHPNIARLYDAGVGALGRPYLAMEYIEGQPLDVWCEGRSLSLRDRLRLFLQVARAVAYAHGRLVVHRDLKPSNVLVTADGQARLLDFGIAKLLSEGAPDDSRLTQEHGRVLTPNFASPEQLRGDTLTVASDVYSLGVLLFELLTGASPYRPKRKGLAALEDAVLENEPALASSRARDKSLAKALRGELDAILAKALQRDPGRRYATADAMAEDIERHLAGERVLAQPDTRLYRLSKLLRRHWVGFGAAAAIGVVAFAGTLEVALQSQRAARAAERERLIKAFVTDVFRSYSRPDPGQTAPRGASPQTIIDGSARLIEARFKDQPELQADLYGVVGSVFSDMGAYRLAADYATRRVATLERATADRLERARALTILAQTLFDDERIAEARARCEEALALTAADPVLDANAQVLLARALIEQGKVEAALATLTRLDKVDAVPAAASPAPAQQPATTARAWARAARARMLVIQNRQDDAIPVYDQAIAMALAAEGRLSTTAIMIRLYVANVLAETLTYATRAQAFHDPAIAALHELGGAHEVRAAFESARFVALRNQLVGVESTEQILTALQNSRAQLTSTPFPLPDWFVPQVDYWIGVTHINDGHIAGGLPLLEATAPLLLQILESPNRRRRVATFFGRTLMYAGKHELADRYLREALEARRASGMGRHPWAAINYRDLATNDLMSGRYAEAESILDQAPEFPPIRGEGMSPVRYGRSLVWTRARVRLMAGKPHEALQLLSSSAPAADETADDLRGYRPVYGEALCAVGRRTEGLAALRQQIAFEEGAAGYPYAPQLARLRSVAGLCALDAGDRPTAVRLGALAHAAFLSQPGVSPFYKTVSLQLDARLAATRLARVPPRPAT